MTRALFVKKRHLPASNCLSAYSAAAHLPIPLSCRRSSFLRARTPFPLDAGFLFRVGRKAGVQLLLFLAQGNAPIGLLRYVAHGPPRLLLAAVAWFLLQRNGCFRLEVFYGD